MGSTPVWAFAPGSNPTKRIERYGTWSGAIGEGISYGAREAREVITDLLIFPRALSHGVRAGPRIEL